MSPLKNELVDLINNIPDAKLLSIKPLLTMIYEDTVVIEPVLFDILSENEKTAVLHGVEEDERGEAVCFDEINWE